MKDVPTRTTFKEIRLTRTRNARRKGYAKPIIAVSAAAMVEARLRAIPAGCSDHISKPFDTHVLLKTVL